MAARYYNYVTEPDDGFKCVLCLQVARDPLQHKECGRLICKECLQEHGEDKHCPNCKTGESKYYQDRRSECVTASTSAMVLLPHHAEIS